MNTQVPRGIEVLVKKASVDPAFKAILLDRRAAAADEIGLQLAPAEAMMLAATPREQLETIVARTSVPQSHRRAFLGQAAAAMLAVLGVLATGGEASTLGGFGNRPDEPDKAKPEEPKPEEKEPDEKNKIIESRVRLLIAKRFRVSGKELKDKNSLVDDFHATASQLVNLRKQLEKQFKVSISRKDFETVRTVRDVVGCVKEAVRRKSGGKLPSMQNATRGIQPDRPPTPAVGGMMPN
jgi:acyl carrier protein